MAKPASDDRALEPADYQALAAFRHGLRRYLAFAEKGARSVGLTPQQHQAMLAIKALSFTRPVSIGDVAAHLLLKHHSVVELISRLEKAGFVQRRADPADRRRVLVSLTGKGEAVMAALSANNLRELRQIAPVFTDLLEQLDPLTDPG